MPHPDENSEQPTDRYFMHCYECGATREVQSPLAASTEVERRREKAKETLQKMNIAS